MGHPQPLGQTKEAIHERLGSGHHQSDAERHSGDRKEDFHLDPARHFRPSRRASAAPAAQR